MHIPKWRPVSLPVCIQPNVKSTHLNDLLAIWGGEVKPPSGIRIRRHPGVEQRNGFSRPCAVTHRVSAVSHFTAIHPLPILRDAIDVSRKRRGNEKNSAQPERSK